VCGARVLSSWLASIYVNMYGSQRAAGAAPLQQHVAMMELDAVTNLIMSGESPRPV
jgi:hypothetical protein